MFSPRLGTLGAAGRWPRAIALAVVVSGAPILAVAGDDTPPDLPATVPDGGAPATDAPRPAPVGPLLVDEILNRYDLNGDGSVDEIEATIGQAKIRRRRSEQRATRDIDPVTSRPRSQSDPTAPLGFRPGGTDGTITPGTEPPAQAALPSAGSAARGGSASEERQRRIRDVIDPQRGRTAPGEDRDPARGAAGQRGSPAPGIATPQPFGWIAGGDGTVFRGGSYPLPDRSRSARAGRGGAGPLLPGSGAPGAGAASSSRSGAAGGSTRYTTPPASRATVPQPSRGGGRTSGSAPAPSGGR
jgi:hypothetical protein